jgi:Ca-activated chloride channel family protein
VSFAHPVGLVVAFGALTLLAVALRLAERRRAAQAFAYSNLAFALEALRPSRWPAVLLFGAFLTGAGALLLTLGGPLFVARVPAPDATVVLCIDTSGSMRSRDIAPTRWDAALAAARSFVEAVPAGTRVGIVSFATDALGIAQPTADLDAVRDAIDRVPPAGGATAMGDALSLAAGEMPAKGRRIIVLLTDGVSNRGPDPILVSQAIGERGITIETVGVGSNDSGQLIPGTTELADLDADALRAIAGNGRGRYVEARDAASLVAGFRALALETVWEKKRVDGSLPFAIGGGVLLLASFLIGVAAGRFP